MNKTQLTNIVRIWQGRLNLDYWDIDLVFDGDTEKLAESDTESPFAQIHTSSQYEIAKIIFRRDWPDWDNYTANRHVVHELMHCHLRDMETYWDVVDGQMHRDVAAVAMEAYRHWQENAIEKISKALVDNWGSVS